MYELAVISLIILLTWCIWDWMDSRDQPPGPFRFPLIGNLYQVAMADPIPFLGFDKLSKKYGQKGLTRLQMGFLNTIVVDSLETMKNILSREECLVRSTGAEFYARNIGQNLGILGSTGLVWQEMRRFSLKTLRDSGLNKRRAVEDMIKVEVTDVIEHIDSFCSSSGKSVDGMNWIVSFDGMFFGVPTVNVLLNMVMGKRYSRFEKHSPLYRFVEVARRLMQSSVLGAGLYNAFPILRMVCPGLVGFTRLQDITEEMREIAREMIREVQAEGNYKISQDCFADEFLKRMDMNDDEVSKEYKTKFTEDQFVITLMDFVQAGSDTTSSSLGFAILLLASHLDVQAKLFDEIIQVVGSDRLPSIEDREKMHYTQAVILEVFRWARAIIFMPREASADFYFEKFLIKKGCVIITNLHSITMSPDLWSDPDDFNPQRFIGENGCIQKELADRVAVFGHGKRSCIGEGMARDTTFLFLTSLIQRYNFGLPSGKPKPSLVPLMGLVATLHPFDATVTLRK